MKNSKFSLLGSLLLLGSHLAIGQRTLASVSFEAKEISAVEVRGSFCDVTIRPGSRNYVEGTIAGSGDEDDYDIIAQIQGETLVVRVETSYNKWNNITKGEIEITLDNVEEIRIDNSSGDIDIEDINARRISLEASSGDISAEELRGEMVLASASSGNLTLIDIEADLRTHTSSGDQRLRQVKGNVDAESTSGNITLNYFEGLVRMESTSGDITINYGKGLTSLRSTSGTIEGRSLMLDTDLILEATSGDITLSLLNDPDDLSFDLESNSGDLDAGRYDGEDELYIKRGTFWIRGKTTSGDISIDF